MVRVRNREGFTLVELLVVIGIIALLIGILLPALNKARATAQQAVCMAQLRQFGVGIQMYVDSNKGALPQKGPDGSTPGPNAFTYTAATQNPYFDDGSVWFNAIPPLVNGKSYFQMLLDDFIGTNRLPVPGDHNIFICPSMSDTVGAPGYDRVLSNAFLLYGSENPAEPPNMQITNSTGLSATGQFRFSSSYVFNSKLTSSIASPTDTAVKMSTLRPGSEVVVMLEKLNSPGEYKDKGVQIYNSKFSLALNGDVTSSGFVNKNIGQAKADWRRFTTRHHGGGNILFADGHVSWYSWTDAQIQPSEMIGGTVYNANLSDANQPGKMIWGINGPVN